MSLNCSEISTYEKIHFELIYAPACPGHCGHFGGGKYPPPTVPPMRYAGTLAYTEQKATCHHTLSQGGGAEEAAVSGGGIEGEHGEGL